MTDLFGFVTRLDVNDVNLLKLSVNNLIKVYSRDLEQNLYVELNQFITISLKSEKIKTITYKHVKNCG